MSGPAAGPRAGEVRHERGSRTRQRQRLIDACISALHIHGPSRTTVEKVVSIANLSPGIVRFYFRSKGAMLVASLQYLATEFEERVLLPVSAMRDTPVAAMRRLVDLYLDPELASARKISVWYAFWGEASARQEYYEICGQKDDSFEVLVRDLMRRLVVQCGDAHLDADALAIGFIGLLEVLWQGFAFQAEADIDRVAARARCLAYLRSIFPRQFGAIAPPAVPEPAGTDGPARAPADAHTRLLRGSDQLLAHDSELVAEGAYLALEVAAAPVVVVRAGLQLGAYMNRCPQSPHELVPRGAGELGPYIECRVHGLRWNLSGLPIEPGAATALEQLAVERRQGFLSLRPTGVRNVAAGALLELAAAPAGGDWQWSGRTLERRVDASWHTVVEHWLDTWCSADAARRFGAMAPPARVVTQGFSARVDWSVELGAPGSRWSVARFVRLAGQAGDSVTWTRHFCPPNALLERHAGGISLLTVLADPDGRSVLRRRTYHPRGAERRLIALGYLADRLGRTWVDEDVAVVESIERARGAGGGQVAPATAGSPLEAFRTLRGKPG